jgi:hypothetical protein
MVTYSYILYSSVQQEHLEGLTALHSVAAQAEGSRVGSLHVRREPIETIHPVVRVSWLEERLRQPWRYPSHARCPQT